MILTLASMMSSTDLNNLKVLQSEESMLHLPNVPHQNSTQVLLTGLTTRKRQLHLQVDNLRCNNSISNKTNSNSNRKNEVIVPEAV